MSGWLVGGGVVACGALATGLLLALRQRSYRRHLKYRPKQDYAANVFGSGVETLPIRCDAQGFILPEVHGDPCGFLELDVCASVAGLSFDPSVVISAPGFRDEQFLERGVCGARFLNVSRLLCSGVRAGEKVGLHGRRLAWNGDPARLHICRERVLDGERVLVVAPHPDDAEIAAFGLYADTNATVVTITAGDGSDRYSGKLGLSIQLSRAMVARMRVWDALTVPQLGGAAPRQTANLCYPDSLLSAMHAEPGRDFRGLGDNALDFVGLRQLNQSQLLQESATCSWESLVRELARVLATVKPSVIAAPHPWLDPHSDHLFTTAAVCEAMQKEGVAGGRFYFYTVHNRRSELWPFGPAGSGVALLPLLPDDIVECDGFYSHALSEQRQQEKFLALEAMHDLREVGAPHPLPLGAQLRRLRAEATAALHGLGQPPTGFLRRAVRPDEVFFTASFERGQELCAKALRRI